MRTLWYMGAKTRLVPDFINGAVGDLLPEGGTILDVCTGTAVVARSFASRYRVFANDVQRFSATVARGYLVGDQSWVKALDFLDPEEDLAAAFDVQYAAVTDLAPRALEREDALLPAVIDELSRRDAGGATEEYRDLLAHAPLTENDAAANTDKRYQPLGARYDELLTARRRDPHTAPYALMTLYYAGIYFGLKQAMTIDALRGAIDAIPLSDVHRERKRDLYLAALVQACSISTSGTSHFAQPRDVSRDSELLAVARRRSIDIELEFHRALDAIRREWGSQPRYSEGNQVWNLPVDQLLGEDGPLEPGQVGLVYLDPPYTADNYSRFYHVLETLVTYDYPELERRGGNITKGRYPSREHRHQSAFCRREKVESAFRGVVEACARLKAKLLVSYSADSGLLFRHWRDRSEEEALAPESRFLELFRDTYADVELRQRDLMHSGQGDSNRSVRELLVLCDTES
ncbi:MAG: DNA adenine methylase [Planctomycetota bacterium]